MSEETGSFSAYMAQLEKASIAGEMDAYYSSQTANRIMQIKTIEQQILQKTKNKALPAILSNSISDLDILYEKFRDFNDTLYD